MKYCGKCGKSFPDNQVFCSECGSSLSGGGRKSNSSTNNVWLPVILAAAGAVVAWYLSGLLGFVLGAVGVKMVLQQKSMGQHEQLPFILTWVFAVIDTIFFFIAITMG